MVPPSLRLPNLSSASSTSSSFGFQQVSHPRRKNFRLLNLSSVGLALSAVGQFESCSGALVNGPLTRPSASSGSGPASSSSSDSGKTHSDGTTAVTSLTSLNLNLLTPLTPSPTPSLDALWSKYLNDRLSETSRLSDSMSSNQKSIANQHPNNNSNDESDDDMDFFYGEDDFDDDDGDDEDDEETSGFADETGRGTDSESRNGNGSNSSSTNSDSDSKKPNGKSKTNSKSKSESKAKKDADSDNLEQYPEVFWQVGFFVGAVLLLLLLTHCVGARMQRRTVTEEGEEVQVQEGQGEGEGRVEGNTNTNQCRLSGVTHESESTVAPANSVKAHVGGPQFFRMDDMV